MGESKNNDPTQTSEINRGESGDAPTVTGGGADSGDEQTGYTAYSATTDASSSTGFDRAAQLARRAQVEQGRLLKKRFVLEDVLGRGGMGLVYKARDLRKVEAEDRNPYIAVKVLGPQFKDHPQAFVSLQQEAVKSQRLAHPNIVTVHDFDRDGDTIFMTMELLKGDPLDALLKLEAPFSKEVALRYFRDLCAGLEYAHKRDLVHSDFKPGNIFVTTGGTAKILDFGIARAANKNALSHDFDVGDLGALTPAYATAEMVNGEAPSSSDDIYALACVLYLMLTGEHPYQRKSAAEAAKAKLKPARPACLNNREWQALAAALSLEKAGRPASIVAFRDALMPPVRNGTRLGVAAAVLVLALAGGWVGYQQFRAQQGQEETLALRMQAARDCFLVEDYTCTIENALVVKNLAPDNADARKLLEAARKEQAELDREELVARRLEEARACLQQRDFGCTRVKLKEVLEIEPGQPRASAMLEQATRLSQQGRVQGILARAEDCLAGGNVSCVEQALADAEVEGASAADVYPVQRRLDALVAEREAASRERDERVASLLAQSESCLQEGDFDCSEARLEDVLALDAGNTRVVELKQSIAAARTQQRFNQRTAAGFLEAAQDCYARKDYSCTIAKSESALAIVPGYGPAETLIDRAELAQKKAKMSISIQ